MSSTVHFRDAIWAEPEFWARSEVKVLGSDDYLDKKNVGIVTLLWLLLLVWHQVFL